MEHPIAAQVVMGNFYVDDTLLSVHKTEQTSEVTHELKLLLLKGGFNLTKWVCNFEEVFENSEITPIESEDIPNVLGLEWIAARDLNESVNCSEGPRIPAEIKFEAKTSFVNSVTSV